ncbi:hypothetical protein ACFVHB_00440 [Kitasatospora sp. NPDC127111]|uniref:hypothetical protein n=1 Tax=Kitasatospora sp. NPDC127111 TaxID=3345363 RepID=UPI0036413739
MTTRTRALLFSVGASMIGAGGTAVFMKDVEAGPTALITIGAVLVVLSAMGRQLSSMNLKEGSFDLADVKDQVNGADSPEQVVEAIVSAPAPVQNQLLQQDTAITDMSEAAYERVIADLLTGYFGDAVQRDVPIGSTRADIVVTLDGKRAVVETRLGNPGRPMPPELLRRLLRQDYLTDDSVHAVIIVSASEPGLYALGRERDRAVHAGKNFAFTSWAGREHNQSLKQAIEDQLRG